MFHQHQTLLLAASAEQQRSACQPHDDRRVSLRARLLARRSRDW